MESAISQIKNIVESLTNRLDEVENRMSGLKDKLDKSEY
jgi:hypothetical protein